MNHISSLSQDHLPTVGIIKQKNCTEIISAQSTASTGNVDDLNPNYTMNMIAQSRNIIIKFNVVSVKWEDSTAATQGTCGYLINLYHQERESKIS